jgi:hypothetical protein
MRGAIAEVAMLPQPGVSDQTSAHILIAFIGLEESSEFGLSKV